MKCQQTLISPNTVYPVDVKTPQELLPWLEHTNTSLTQKLTQQFGSTPHVVVTKQAWERACYWDKHFLNISCELIFKREIFMTLHKKKCWYAKTLIPEICYQLDSYFFNRLENGPLTPLVFDEPRVKRVQLFHYPINEACVEFYWVRSIMHTVTPPLWVRFSHFEFLGRESFYLIEIFLPHFLQVVSND